MIFMIWDSIGGLRWARGPSKKESAQKGTRRKVTKGTMGANTAAPTPNAKARLLTAMSE